MVKVRLPVGAAACSGVGIRLLGGSEAGELVQPRTALLTSENTAARILGNLVDGEGFVAVAIRCTPTTLLNRLISFHNPKSIHPVALLCNTFF